MQFRQDIFSAVSAFLLITSIAETDGVEASSQIVKHLVSESRALENNAIDYSWIADYSIQFQSCLSVLQYGGEGGGGGEEGTKIRKQNLVKFRLCPTDSCGKSCKGEYLIELNQFAESYLESKEEEQERACEAVEESCYCNDDAVDDQQCMNTCYENAGLSDCIETDDDGEEVEIERLMECELLGEDNNNNNNYNYNTAQNNFYVGARCSSNGKSVYLDVFSDSMCTKVAPSGTYEKYSYGKALPYQKKSIFSDDCIPCTEYQEDDNNGRRLDEVALSEMCDRTYEESAKCEKGLNIKYPQNDECWFIKSGVQKHAIGYKNYSSMILTSVLFLGCLGLGFMVYDLQQKGAKGTIHLPGSGLL